jgi:hypothetical protein
MACNREKKLKIMIIRWLYIRFQVMIIVLKWDQWSTGSVLRRSGNMEKYWYNKYENIILHLNKIYIEWRTGKYCHIAMTTVN